MKIMVVSDSHGRLANLKKAYEKVRPVDLFLHLGDVTGDEDTISSFVTCRKEFVCGNCDYDSLAPYDKVIEAGGKRILMTHGHRHDAGWGVSGLIRAGRQNAADIVMFGHTHVPMLRYEDDLVLFNPGSISLPRQDGHRPTFGVVEINEKGEVLFNTVEL